jgi:hypothetical protein
VLNFHRSSLCNLFHHLPFPNLQATAQNHPTGHGAQRANRSHLLTHLVSRETSLISNFPFPRLSIPRFTSIVARSVSKLHFVTGISLHQNVRIHRVRPPAARYLHYKLIIR